MYVIKHTCSITQQINEGIQTYAHIKTKKNKENDDFNKI